MDLATAVVIAVVSICLALILLCCWCLWLLHRDGNIAELIKEILQALGACVQVILSSIGEFILPGPGVAVMLLLALLLVLLVIAFSFFDRLTIHEEVIIGLGYGFLVVLAYLRGLPLGGNEDRNQ